MIYFEKICNFCYHFGFIRGLFAQADATRDELARALSTATVSYSAVNAASKKYIPNIHQVLYSCKVQPDAARLDQKLLFEWTSGIESAKNPNKIPPTTFSSEALMYELVMTIASYGLSSAGMGCDASIAGDFATAAKEFKKAAGVFEHLGQDQLPKWIARGSSVDEKSLPAEATTGVCDAFSILYLAFAQQMAVATSMLKNTKPNYTLMAKLVLGISEQIEDSVKVFRTKAPTQMQTLDEAFLSLLAFQSAYTRGLSSYFLARSSWEEDSAYGLAIAQMHEAIGKLKTRENAHSQGIPDVDGKNSPLKALSKDMQNVRAHMNTILKAWEKDNSSVYFDNVPSPIPVGSRLTQGLRLLKQGEKFALDENPTPMPLSLPLYRALIPPPYSPSRVDLKRSDSDLARELQAKLNAGQD